MIYLDYPDCDDPPSLMRRRKATFASTPLQIVLRPGETVSEGDWVIVDRTTGKLRKAKPEDEGHKFTVPPGSRVNENGYLEMSR